MDRGTRILISGGGIAGLSLAYWLVKYGFQPVVVEKSPKPREQGYAITLGGAGLEILRKMGRYDDLQGRNIQPGDNCYLDRGGRPVFRLDYGKLTRDLKENGEEIITVTRGDIQDLLAMSAAEVGVNVRQGRSIRAIEQNEKDVHVTFDDGGEERFDLVFGADGIHSQVRRLVFGEEQQFTRFLNAYVGAFKMPNTFGFEYGTTTHIEPRRMSSLYVYGEKDIIMMFIFTAERPERIAPKDRKARLIEEYRKTGWKHFDVLEQAPSSEDIYLDAAIQVVMPKWHRGRVALVGDAAHCLTLLAGQGASLAMSGTYVLAKYISESDDHSVAFESYESKLRPDSNRLQESSRKMSRFVVPTTEFGYQFRNLILRVVPTKFLINSVKRAHDLIDLDKMLK